MKFCLVLLTIEFFVCMILYRGNKGKVDTLDPFIWCSVIYFAIMVYAPYTWVERGIWTWHGAPVLQNLPLGTFYFGVSYVFFMLGCLGNAKDRIIPWEGSEDHDAAYARIAWGCFIFGFLLSLLYLRYRGKSLFTTLTLGTRGGFTEDLSTEYNFWFLGQSSRILISSVVLLLAYEHKRRVMAYLAYFLSFMIVLSAGVRNQLLVILLAPFIYRSFITGRRPKVRTLLLAGFVLYFVMAYVGMWRGVFRSGGTLQLRDASSTTQAFMTNIEVFFPYYTMISTVPRSFPHQLGLSYLYVFIQFIPRALWSSKPVSAVTNVNIAMFGAYAASGPAYPNFAEMYLDFNVIGMVIGMYIFGRVCKRMLHKAKYYERSKLDIISYSIFLPYMFQYITRGHFPSIATEVVFMWAPIWVMRYVQKRSHD